MRMLGRKTICVGYWRWLGHTFALPNAKDTNMLVSFALGDAHFFVNPQRESGEYRLRWVPNANFLHWPCTFHSRWVANANPISSGIWALHVSMPHVFSYHKGHQWFGVKGSDSSSNCHFRCSCCSEKTTS